MSIKQMPGRVLISLLLSVTGLLSGCASHNENASLLAKKQAQNISQNLPIKSAGYTLVLAQSSGTTVKMTIISEAVLRPRRRLMPFFNQLSTTNVR